MRSPFRSNYFDYALNLFTSFGYFISSNDDLKVFKSIGNSLKKNGVFVFDYLNKGEIICNLQPQQEITKNNIKFTINKQIEGDKVIKQIQVNDGGNIHQYFESVNLYSLDAILALASKVGLEKEAIFGDYNLNEYNAATSSRMIIFFRKK